MHNIYSKSKDYCKIFFIELYDDSQDAGRFI